MAARLLTTWTLGRAACGSWDSGTVPPTRSALAPSAVPSPVTEDCGMGGICAADNTPALRSALPAKAVASPVVWLIGMLGS